jgi:hypothetical protein
MSREKLYKYLIVGLIVLGSILRLTVFWISPPNNAYDNHLEVVNIYAQDFNRPLPFQCWECYQPPLYYYIGAVVYNISKGLGSSQETCWKVVQGINPVLSILLLIIAYQILFLLNLCNRFIAIVLSFLIVLPRDIFTSVMIGNDYLLVFCSIASFYFFIVTLNALREGNSFYLRLGLLVLIATLGSLSKQHGLLLHLFPGTIFLLLLRKGYRKMLCWAIPILLLGVMSSISEEVWKYNKTGNFLVSNQDYFDYAENQYPGSLEKVEFFTFRIVRLYQNPFISEKTSASFFTELFARTFYDYEWRFISPKIPWASNLGYISYSVGLVWIVFFITIIVSWLKQNIKAGLKTELYATASKVTPIIVALLFMMVPFLQTLRYPYFSSMKSMFMLSGIIISLLVIGSLLKEKILSQKMGNYIIALNISYGILLVISILLYLEISLNYLHGPLWLLPKK